MRFYAVEAKCGHVGKFNCVCVRFAVKADSGKEAASKVRNFSRVKRHHKDFIRSLKEVSYEEYRLLLLENRYDPYLHCKNVQQQKGIAFLVTELRPMSITYQGLTERKPVTLNTVSKNSKCSLKVQSVKLQIVLCEI